MRLFGLLLIAAIPMWSQPPVAVQAMGKINDTTCVFGGDVTAGNILIVALSEESGTITAIADTVSTSYGSPAATVTGGGITTKLWIGVAGGTGANTVTWTVTSPSFANTTCAEFSHVTATVDTSVTGSFTGTPATVTTSNLTTTINGDLLYGRIAGFRSAGFFAPGTGYTYSWDSNLNDSVGSEFSLAGTNGTYNATWSNTTNDQGNYILIALKAATVLAVTTEALPVAALSVPYSYSLAAEAGTGAYTWAITAGALPTGLTLSGNLISGTPTAGLGDNSLTFQVTDGAATTATKSLVLHLAASFPAISEVQTNNDSNALAFASNVTAGNLLLVSQQCEQPDCINVVTDTRSTVYRLVGVYGIGSGGNGSVAVALFAGIAPTSGADTVTIHSNDFAGKQIISEFANAQLFFDQEVTNHGSGGATITSGTLTTLVPNELLYTAGLGFTAATTLTLQSPFTTDTSSASYAASGYDVVTTVTGYTASYSMSGNTNGNWAIVLSGFRPTTTTFLPDTVPFTALGATGGPAGTGQRVFVTAH